jgi:hypothetical protein
MTAANDQIRDINGIFGTSLSNWNSAANAGFGIGVWRPLRPRVAAGVQLEFNRTTLDGTQQVGPVGNGQRLTFSGRHGSNLQLRAALEYRPCLLCRTAVPFLRVEFGAAYLRDERTLTLATNGSPSSVSARASGVVPASSIGVGLDTPLGVTDAWRVEFGGAYAWVKLRKTVPTSGPLLGMSEVEIESELTGPSAWIGLSYRF